RKKLLKAILYMEKYDTPELHQKLVKILLLVITSILDRENISYWIDGGTLLGAVRHKNMIPHDDDADIGLLTYDYKVKLPQVLDEIRGKSIASHDGDYSIEVDVSR